MKGTARFHEREAPPPASNPRFHRRNGRRTAPAESLRLPAEAEAIGVDTGGTARGAAHLRDHAEDGPSVPLPVMLGTCCVFCLRSLEPCIQG